MRVLAFLRARAARNIALAWVVVACVLALMPGRAVAQTLTPIPPPPPVRAPLQAPRIDPPADLAALVGRPLMRVSVVLEGNVWPDVEVPPVASVKPGEPLTAALARRALGELLATGRFARGDVSASPDGVGAALVVRVVPRKLVRRLDLDLHGARVDYDELLRDAGLAEGGEIVGADIAETAARIERTLAVHGYPEARATLQTHATEEPMRTVVLVDVVPGPARVVDERAFYVFDANPEDVVPLAVAAYAVREGDRADGPVLDVADGALEQSLRARGWYRARVTHDLVWVDEPPSRLGPLSSSLRDPRSRLGPLSSSLRDPRRVVLRVRIDTGPLQVAQFEGNDHYDDAALAGALNLGTEVDRTPSHLADKLRAFYQKRGYLDVEVAAELRGSDRDPVQVLVFHVGEGRRVRVATRRYPCLKMDAIRHLSNGGPRSPAEIGTEIDSFLEEELPGTDLFVAPHSQGLSMTMGAGAGQIPTGGRPAPAELDPDRVYIADIYDRAAEHVQELYRNEGFLHAEVGPVQIVRGQCDRRSPPGRCVPQPQPPMEVATCTYDPTGLPLPTQPLDPSASCHPDSAHGVECAPEVQLIIPVKLGPRTQLWDVALTGVKSVSEKAVADAAQVPLGEYVSTAKLDDARRRIVDWYKELGYAYVDVKYALEPSLDNTRVRVRFDVTEGDQVIISGIVLRGLVRTRESVVRRRIALTVGEPYRTSDVRKTQERLATLGVFSSVSPSLADPYVPASTKVVVIDFVEAVPGRFEPKGGFSTGEGVRLGFDLEYRNLFGYAWSVVVHGQASYLPSFLILDPQVAQNYNPLSWPDRVATRDTVTLAFPEMGLGPTVRSQLDGVYVRDLERDFTLVKASGLGTLIWRPTRQIQLAGGPDYENNQVHLFGGGLIEQYLNSPQAQNNVNLARVLRVPDGTSNVVAVRAVATWDRRDSAFNAHSGTYIALGAEQVNSYPVQGSTVANRELEGHILRLTQTIAGYLPLSSKVSFAAELRLGEVANLVPCRAPFDTSGIAPPTYCTYPDRLFFMGGFDSMRGWLQDAFIPQEYVDQIRAGSTTIVCTSQSNCNIPLRGGNLMINPRFELRFPVRSPIDGAVFADFGNLWNDPNYFLQHSLTIRADVGAGVRVQTPVGPLVFDYGVNVTRLSYEDFGAFHFAIGLY
jgi:outer membrane protein assembly factor BamA